MHTRLYDSDTVDQILTELRDARLDIEDNRDDDTFEVTYCGDPVFAGIRHPGGFWICRVHDKFFDGQ